ncbi:MAG: sigma-70 family RNA polymerase sigma factor [Acidobacteriota bacterium]
MSRTKQEEALAPSLEDWSDLSRTAAGDEVAFGRILARHQERLYALCFRLLQDRGEAEDAAQEVFLKLYRKASTFEPRGQLFTLLYRMATNHCLNRLRRRKIAQFLPLQRQGASDDDTFELDPPDPSPEPDRATASRERWRATRAALQKLPRNQLAVVVLVRFEGLAYKEAAEVLGVTVGAVESRLFRAMRRLERDLEGHGPVAG